jgi:hypothetical protein
MGKGLFLLSRIVTLDLLQAAFNDFFELMSSHLESSYGIHDLAVLQVEGGCFIAVQFGD